MTLRSYVTFEDALTPVADVTADGDSPPAGGLLAEQLARGLQARGLALSRPVSQWEGYGWEFTVNADGRDVWFMLQRSDEWLVISDARRTLIEKVRRTRIEEPHRKALAALASVLAQPRFTNVRWFTREDFDNQNGGTSTLAP